MLKYFSILFTLLTLVLAGCSFSDPEEVQAQMDQEHAQKIEEQERQQEEEAKKLLAQEAAAAEVLLQKRQLQKKLKPHDLLRLTMRMLWIKLKSY